MVPLLYLPRRFKNTDSALDLVATEPSIGLKSMLVSTSPRLTDTRSPRQGLVAGDDQVDKDDLGYCSYVAVLAFIAPGEGSVRLNTKPSN